MKVMRLCEGNVTAENGFKVGDVIEIGKYTASCMKVGKNGAIFCMDQYLDEALPMNKERTNEGGYEGSDLRKTLISMFATGTLFDEVKEYIVPFKNGDMLRIPTAEEVFGPEVAHEYYETLSNKKQWPLMKDRSYRVAYRGDDQEIEWGWLANKYKDSAAYFAFVGAHGVASHYYASGATGVRVVFRLKLV